MKKLFTILGLSVAVFSYGQSNYSAQFDGIDDYIEIAHADTFNFGSGDFTIMHWWKSGPTNGHIGGGVVKISSFNNQYWDISIAQSPNNFKPAFHINNGNFDTPGDYLAPAITEVDDSSWHFLAGVRNADTIHIYINGVLEGSFTMPANVNPDNIGPIKIGNTQGDTVVGIHSIDDVSLWNYALDSTEIQQYMNCPPSGNENGLVGFWNFEQGTGTTISDITGNGNNGTIYGALWSTDVPNVTSQPNSNFSFVDSTLIVYFSDSSSYATSWYWDFGDGNTDTVQNPTHTYTNCGTYYVCLTAINACGSDTMCDSVTANKSYSTPATKTICDDDSILLQGAWQNTSGTYFDTVLSVNSCDSVIATTLTVNPTYSTPATATICSNDSILLQGAWQNSAGIYYDTVSTLSGCDSVIATSLTVNSSYIISNTAEICNGDSILLDGTYQTAAGTYYDTLSTGNNCDSIIETALTLNPLPAKPVISQNGNILASSPAVAYQWYYFDTLIGGAVSQFYTATQSGFYSVRVTDANGCSSISDPFSLTISDIPNLQGLQNLTGLKIYPNPNTGEFIIEIKNPRGFQNLVGLEIKLLNTIGQVIYEEKLNKIKGTYQTKIDLSGYAKGIYTLTITSNEGVINKKIIIE
ncbi:MAG: T9SS type A sorting domain-containing protein [Cytophagales bacterium]|nr:T9SS type A sorting domain-containing protein [Cytophagales bacterium]